jgi:microcystin-dependent protein
MADPFVGQILLLPFNFAPAGYAFCQGQLLPIAQNTALFSLLGTTYGGNGVSTFALPDLQGRVALGSGQGPGLSDRSPGETGGSDAVTVGIAATPNHTHVIDIGALTVDARCWSGAGTSQSPVGNVPAVEVAGGPAAYVNAAPDAAMQAGAVTVGGTMTAAAAGGGQAHDNLEPYLTLNFCIALQGVFPPRP